ncbi:GNAT family N-acetyltransferase [Roseateles albus]|uniref:GNAT family N-acetyltransferase n=1 Tax=Roseateles albus TaxID=2987525 RepID=A0ABT5KBL0_9BURK|nr:GNAT family N-acetyltransferase [Roseateles albus]MDC8771321.1 GNAT family N-acetyltransferase [Roseateles albus]
MNSEKLKIIDSLTIRPSADADIGAIQAIYALAVQQGTGTFETETPSLEEMGRRRAEVLGRKLPWLVAEAGGRVLGYAYANYFRPRLAYRFCVEDSIYLHPDVRGMGLGKLLLAELIARCEQQGARQMLAVIGDADNQGSIGIHRSLGFQHTGVLKSAGWKFGRWLDVVMMQRELGQGDQNSPEADPQGSPA